MPSMPPSRTLKDIDTLPDGGAIITSDGVFASSDDVIDASSSGDGVPVLPPVFGPELDVVLSERKTDPTEMPLRRPFDEEPTRKALAPKKLPKTERETTDVVDVSSWDNFRNALDSDGGDDRGDEN